MIDYRAAIGQTQSKASNRAAILECVSTAGEIARVDIAQETGINPATITTLTGEMLEEKLLDTIEDEEKSNSGRGRPRVKLRLNPDAFVLAGAKISENSITVAIVDFAGQQISDYRLMDNTFPLTREELALKVKETVKLAAKKANLALEDISALGVGVPGYVDIQSDCVYWSPALSDSPTNFVEALQETFSFPVMLDNDANLATLAEQRFGWGKGVKDFLVVTIEHGVGMGVVLNNRIFRGIRGLGCEFGHTKVQLNGALCRCGQRGCLEAYVADYALLREADTAFKFRMVEELPSGKRLDALYHQAKAGNETALAIFERAGKMFGMGLANLVNIFDPELIIFSGERMQFDLLYEENVLEELRHNSLQTNRPPPEVRVHKWGDLLWAKGAAAWATEYVIYDAAIQTNGR